MTQRTCLLQLLAVFIVSTCVYIITQSFLMSAGIMVLLMLLDSFLVQYDNKRRKEYEERKRREEQP